MEEDDKGCPMIRMGVSGCVFLLVPAYPGCPGPKAVKRLCVCVCVCGVCVCCVCVCLWCVCVCVLSSFRNTCPYHTVATCFAVVPKLCHLFLISLSAHHLEIWDTLLRNDRKKLILYVHSIDFLLVTNIS